MDKIIVTIGGGVLVAFIYWFFFGKKDEVIEVRNKVNILVEGGYKPSVIRIKKGQKTTISLIRKDTNSCLEEFILPDFRISKYLPFNQKVEIEITPNKKGEFSFHCEMNMFHGRIVVE